MPPFETLGRGVAVHLRTRTVFHPHLHIDNSQKRDVYRTYAKYVIRCAAQNLLGPDTIDVDKSIKVDYRSPNLLSSHVYARQRTRFLPANSRQLPQSEILVYPKACPRAQILKTGAKSPTVACCRLESTTFSQQEDAAQQNFTQMARWVLAGAARHGLRFLNQRRRFPDMHSERELSIIGRLKISHRHWEGTWIHQLRQRRKTRN